MQEGRDGDDLLCLGACVAIATRGIWSSTCGRIIGCAGGWLIMRGAGRRR